jgi:hyperosmotically inducible periplasmic protein
MQSTLKKAVLASGLAASVAIMALTGCQTSSDRSAGRQLDDRIVNSKVKDALEDHPMYKFPEVRVMTYGGVVQLSGFVNSDEQKTKAGDLAKRVEGVHEVINNISLKPTATGRETGYQQSTEQKRIDTNVKVDSRDADVKVDTRTK